MSSFYAELVLAGSTYPVRRCEFSFSQATDARGRVRAKVRHGLLHLTLDVPDNDQLLAWAQAVHKPQAGHITFFETNQRTARETVSFAAGQCVGYEEIFEVGNGNAGAYVCQLIITTEGLVLTPGGPAEAFRMPAPGTHGTPAVLVSAAAIVSDIPPHLPAPQPQPSPDHQQLYLSQTEWQDLTRGRWDRRNNKRLLKQYRQTEIQVEGSPFTYRVDDKGKIIAVYDAQKSYNITGTRKGYAGIPLTLNGEPTFAGTPHMHPVTSPQKNVVLIKMGGTRAADFKAANEEAGLSALLAAQGRKPDSAPRGYTWHHRDDFKPNPNPPPYGTCTMELVTQRAHNRTFVHVGACDQCNKHLGRKQYK